MSGVAGGTRIQREDVKPTFEKYKKLVLSKIPSYRQAVLSGSAKLGIKPDYGDLDLVVHFEGEDKQKVKQEVIDVVKNISNSIIVPFKSEKYKGRKYYNSGEIVTVLFPIEGRKDEYIQVDNIVALTEEEHTFKASFLDLPAEKQGLILGLAKVILLEEEPTSVFTRMGIGEVPPLGEGEEYEFNLSSVKLTLRKVKLENFKEIERQEVWETTDWNKIKELFVNYNIDGSFEQLLEDLANKLKNPRSKRRVAGIFKSMVSVKSGEVGTPKGHSKERALGQVAATLTEALEDGTTRVSLFPGGFKPPHMGHFSNAKDLASASEKLIIYIGPKLREGIEITAEQSRKIWNIYAKYLNIPVEIYISAITPVRDVYEWIDKNQEEVSEIHLGSIEGEDITKGRYGAIVKNPDKYSKVKIRPFKKIIGKTVDVEGGELKLSASSIRDSIDYLKSGVWIPSELSEKDKKEVIKIALGEFYDKTGEVLEQYINEVEQYFGEQIKSVIDEEMAGAAIAPRATLTSEKRVELSQLYNDIKEEIKNQGFEIEYVQDMILIKSSDSLKEEVEQEIPSFTEFMASLLAFMMKQGLKINPLPDVVVKNDETEATNFFGKTADYDPEGRKITLYTQGRHPKDIVRSFSHEMIHHIQCLEGKLSNISTSNINEDDYLASLEEEAYLKGNILFRKWEDDYKNKQSK